MEKKELVELINMVLDSRKDYDPMGKLTSDRLDKLAPALSQMQGEYKSVIPNRINPHYKSKYADLDGALKTIRPLLKKHGFSLIQGEEEHHEVKYLRTKLLHNSGQFISAFVKIIQDKQGLQGYGSGLSYHKRYSANSLLGLTTDNDPVDNDAEPQKKQDSTEKKVNKKAKIKPLEKEKLLSENEVFFICTMLENFDGIRQDLLKSLKKERIKDCPKKLFDTMVEFIDARRAELKEKDD